MIDVKTTKNEKESLNENSTEFCTKRCGDGISNRTASVSVFDVGVGFSIFFGVCFESVGFPKTSVSVFPRSPYVYYVIFQNKRIYVIRQSHNVTLKIR
jgi:hypothetical protein